jgi:glucose-6-phosphate isomerase
MSRLTESAVWQELSDHHQEMTGIHMRDMFRDDPARFDKFSLHFKDILFDYSKNRINDKTMELLFRLAKEAGLDEWVRKFFQGDTVNHTENRPALHFALRNRSTESVMVNGRDVMPDIRQELKKIGEISEAIRTRTWRGCTNQPITDVVNIGVGGSDLGPVMITEALRPYSIHDLNIHYVSNVDENHIWDTLERLKPETTLFIVSSKSFTTVDTLMNARTAKEWFRHVCQGGLYFKNHFLAVTSNPEAAEQFGIHPDNILRIWEWVGGRYSLWSAIGLPIAISIGMKNFEALLQGAHEMDEHFRTMPFEQNMPVVLALLGVWYNNFFHSQAYTILPYDRHLHRLPAYLQQADMESNGKRVDRQGSITDYSTGQVVFGELGTNAQHAFYQSLHQGTKMIPADIIASMQRYQDIGQHHEVLMSNVFAQAEALMNGKTEDQVRDEMQQQGADEKEIERLLPYRVFPGNKPTNTIIFDSLTPETLGALIALYEHKIFVQGVIWNVNSFDQWGVELGKQLASRVLGELTDAEEVTSHDSSTNGLINYYKKQRQNHNGSG